MTGLERWYRRLMHAYPRWYRRERGVEILTTLLDDAGPEQRRPSVASVLDLVRGGLRARFRPADGLGWVVAFVVAVYFGIAGASAGVSASGFPEPPPAADAVAVATVAMARTPHDVPGPPVYCDYGTCPARTAADDVVAYVTAADHTDHTVVSFPTPWDEVPASVADARERLRSAGWKVSPVQAQADGYRSFKATRGRQNLYVHAGPPTPYDTRPNGVDVSLSKGHSAGAIALTAAGFAAGMLIGWQIAVWLTQRARRHGSVRRVAIGVVTTPLMLVGLAYSTMMVNLTIGLLSGGFESRPSIVKFSLMIMPGEGYLWIGTAVVSASALIGVVLAGLPDHGRARGASTEPPQLSH